MSDMQKSNLTHEYLQYKKHQGYFSLDTFKAVHIKGPDSADYLNRMSTINFKNFNKEKVSYGAFLTGKANVIALGFFHAYEEGFCFWTEESSQALEHIEKFHFSENFTTETREDLNLSAILKKEGSPMLLKENSWADSVRDLTFQINHKNIEPELSSELFDYLRVLTRVPKVGVEIRPHDLVLEANFDVVVERNKGCYPGQEVVERIFTYGSVNKKLFPIKINNFDPQKNYLGDVIVQDKKIGEVVSYYQNLEKPTEGFGLSYFHKNYWDVSHHIIS